MSQSVLAKIANGAKWTALTRIAIRLIGLISTLVLARLLTPHDFGLVALGMVFIGFLQLLGSFDFDTVLIQHPNPTRDHYDTAWTFNALYFIIAAIGLAVAAPTLARFYDTPALTDILYVLAFGFVLTGLNNIKTVDFQKNFRFRYDFALTLSAKVISFTVTIFCAFILKNYWALLAGFIANRLTTFIAGYWLAPYRPRITVSEYRSLFRFSSWLMLKNIFYFINNKSTELIIGKTLGTLPLGIYTVGSDIANMASQELTSTINRAAYPGYAKLAEQTKELRRTVLRIYGAVATIAIPISVGLYFVAPLLVKVVLGDKWLPAVPIVEIIAISGLFMSLQSNLGYVFLAIRKPEIDAMISGIRACVLLPLVYMLSKQHGVTGAAAAILAATMATLPVNVILLRFYIKLGVMHLLFSTLRPAIAVIAMAVVLAHMPLPFATDAPLQYALVNLLAQVAAGAATYTVILILAWLISGRPEGLERAVLATLSKRRFAKNL